jgi:hypothetical protein
VPLGYDTATSTEKALANTKQRLTQATGLTAAHVHPELGFARLVLRDYEPMAETRLTTIPDEVATVLQAIHEKRGEEVMMEASFISRSFELNLDLNGEAGKGVIKGKMELYHVEVNERTTWGAGNKAPAGEKPAGCCGGGQGGKGGSCNVM